MKKGQKTPSAAVAAMSDRLKSEFRDKFSYSHIEPYLDWDFGKASKKLPLVRYWECVKGGMSAKEIRQKHGAHNDLLQFYSALSQGQIVFDAGKFKELYESGLSLNEVGQQFGIQNRFMRFVRQGLGVKRTGAKFQKRKAAEHQPTERQLDLIRGSLLGDAKKTSPSTVGFGHGDSQKRYLIWKYQELEDLASENSLKPWPYKDKRSGYEGIKWAFYTHANSWIEEIVGEMYPYGTKIAPQSLTDRLTPFSVALWYMDDGKIDWRWRDKEARGTHDQRWGSSLCLCTESFDIDSIANLIRCLRDKFGIKSKMAPRKLKSGIGYRIQVKRESIKDFLDLVRPHVIPSMMYKVDYDCYLKWRKDKNKNK
jgi:hypothetical protein